MFKLVCTCVLLGVNVAVAGPPPTSGPTAAVDASPTPSEAIQNWWKAVAAGDQKELDRRVVIRSSTGYCTAYSRWRFVSSRLHDAVAKAGMRDVELSPGLIPRAPSERNMPSMLDKLKAAKWNVTGNTAVPAEAKYKQSEFGAVATERAGDGWVIVLSDPDLGVPPATLKQFAAEFTATADAEEVAIHDVGAGTLASVGRVNDDVNGKFQAVKAKRDSK